MPRKASLRSLLAPLQHRAATAVAALRREITQREKELADLKAEHARWQDVAHPQLGPAHPPTATRRRLDWGALLRELPARFTTKDVATKTGKPLPHVYAGIWRWTKDKKITKAKTGYRKVSAAGS
jgi:hypothetical protein